MRNGPYELVIAPPNYPGKRYRDRYCYEHQLVWWQNTREVPGPDELIHHKNEQKRDNRYENLEKITVAKHKRHHGEKNHEAVAVTLVCPWCKKSFKAYGTDYRGRLKRSISGYLFCSRSCQATWCHNHK